MTDDVSVIQCRKCDEWIKFTGGKMGKHVSEKHGFANLQATYTEVYFGLKKITKEEYKKLNRGSKNDTA